MESWSLAKIASARVRRIFVEKVLQLRREHYPNLRAGANTLPSPVYEEAELRRAYGISGSTQKKWMREYGPGGRR